MVAGSEHDVAHGLDDAIGAMLGRAGPGSARLSTQDSEPRGPRLRAVDDASRAELTIPLDEPGPHSQRAAVFTGPANDMVELTPMLEALADQAGLALTRIGLEDRLRSEERERYFRSLVLTSRDVTLICRQGRIEYATPSARALFGYEVQGRMFDTVVRRDRPGPAETRMGPLAWGPFEEGTQGFVDNGGGRVTTVEVHRRDLTDDPTVKRSGDDAARRDRGARACARIWPTGPSHDALTGLANAELFREELRADRANVAPPVGGGAVLFVDLDDFKTVNDTYGHEIGDGLLMTVAHRIRVVPARADDLAARLGGDEFAVLLRDVPDADAARAVAQRIADSLGPADHRGRGQPRLPGQHRAGHRDRAGRVRLAAARGRHRAVHREGRRQGPLAAVPRRAWPAPTRRTSDVRAGSRTRSTGRR